MKTFCYQLWGNFQESLEEIKEKIPCFVYVDSKANEVYITCREEDAAFVERVLAPYV